MRNKTSKPLPMPLKTALRWAFFILCAVIFAAFATAGSTEHSKAYLLIPISVAVSVFSGEIESAAFGGFCGILTDLSTGQLLGFSAVYLCLVCGLVSALFRQFLRKNFINCMALTALALFLYLYIDYFFYYIIWEFEGYKTVLKSKLLPGVFKTLLWAPLIFYTVRLAVKLSGDRRPLNIEETDEKIDRV